MAIVQNAEFWVFVGVALFFVLITVLKAPHAAFRSLDARSSKIQAALDEAEQLRNEARVLLASLQVRQAEAEVQAAQMLEEARAEGRRLEVEAKERLEEQITRRTLLADRRIALAEQQAAAEVRSAATDLAARIAEIILARRLDGLTSDPSIDRAVAELGPRLQ